MERDSVLKIQEEVRQVPKEISPRLNRTRSMPTRKAKAQRFRNGSILLSDDSTAAHAKNKLYFGFRELGRVVRTIFLLR